MVRDFAHEARDGLTAMGREIDQGRQPASDDRNSNPARLDEDNAILL
jgi:hypothetical protein